LIDPGRQAEFLREPKSRIRERQKKIVAPLPFCIRKTAGLTSAMNPGRAVQQTGASAPCQAHLGGRYSTAVDARNHHTRLSSRRRRPLQRWSGGGRGAVRGLTQHRPNLSLVDEAEYENLKEVPGERAGGLLEKRPVQEELGRVSQSRECESDPTE
jgi:hypothetical protein